MKVARPRVDKSQIRNHIFKVYKHENFKFHCMALGALQSPCLCLWNAVVVFPM